MSVPWRGALLPTSYGEENRWSTKQLRSRRGQGWEQMGREPSDVQPSFTAHAEP